MTVRHASQRLDLGVRARLLSLKIQASGFNSRHVAQIDWRAWRGTHPLFGQAPEGFGTNGTHPVFVTFDEDYFGSRLSDAGDVKGVNLRHNGWFVDEHQEGMAIGIVAFLPHGRLLSGYRLTDTGETVLFLDHVETDAVDAAYRADAIAEQYAEAEREHNQAADEIRARLCELAGEMYGAVDEVRELRMRHSMTILAATVSRDAGTTAKRRAQARDIREIVAQRVADIRGYRAELASLEAQQ